MNTKIEGNGFKIESDEGLDKIKEILPLFISKENKPILENTSKNLTATLDIKDSEGIKEKLKEVSEALESSKIAMTNLKGEKLEMETQKMGFQEEVNILTEKLEDKINENEKLYSKLQGQIEQNTKLTKENNSLKEIILELEKDIEINKEQQNKNQEVAEVVQKEVVKDDVEILEQATKTTPKTVEIKEEVKRDFNPQNPEDIANLEKKLKATLQPNLIEENVDVFKKTPIVEVEEVKQEIIDGHSIVRNEEGNVIQIDSVILSLNEQFALQAGLTTVVNLAHNHQSLLQSRKEDAERVIGGYDE